jgi:hypothetical protein
MKKKAKKKVPAKKKARKVPAKKKAARRTPRPPMPRGRPTLYTPALARVICARLAEGESLREICGGKSETMPARTSVYEWLHDHPEFADQYARAREMGADALVDEMLEIADNATNDWQERQLASGEIITVPDHEHIARSKLRIDARKWKAAKMAPKSYSERVTAEISGVGGKPIETSAGISAELEARIIEATRLAAAVEAPASFHGEGEA